MLTRDGQLVGIVAEVGGFLDMGDKHVMVSVGDVNLVAVDDQQIGFYTRMNEEQLEAMEGVGRRLLGLTDPGDTERGPIGGPFFMAATLGC